MVFSSLVFLFIFLPPVLAAYFLCRGRWKGFLRNLVLLLASLVFYAWGEPVYILLMVFSIGVNFLFGLFLEGEKKHKRVLLALALFFNAGLLVLFKYADLLIRTFNYWTGADLPLPGLGLPIGISFYSFQAMSYVIDVYRGQVSANRNLITFGTYISMFPQLIAGPIVRYKTVAEELKNRRENTDDFSAGIFRFLMGLGKKVLLADSMGKVWDQVSAMGSDLSTLTAWLGLLAVSLQIYLDFSAYSDMAIGLGRMFGFHFMENFDYPYESSSITEFWRRWHISLGTWFKEYVYIPLGGNRRGKGRQIFNILLVWVLTGLWHGASWNFLCWGLYYAFLLLLEKILLGPFLKKLPTVLKRSYTLLLVFFGWWIFSWTDIKFPALFARAVFFRAPQGLADHQAVFLLLNSLGFFVLAVIGSTSLPKRAAWKLPGREWPLALYSLLVFALSLAFLVSDTYHPFLYFRF